MVIPAPMPLIQQAEPFDDPNWIYEIKHDGFRAFAVIEHGGCRFFSRKKHKLPGYRTLREAMVKEVNADSAILDGELVATDQRGRTAFADISQRTKPVRYVAFDLLWLNGEDLRAEPLLARKKKLNVILPTRSAHLLYVDHTVGAGRRLYELACEMDLKGIVGEASR